MSNIERRVERLEAVMPSHDEFIIICVVGRDGKATKSELRGIRYEGRHVERKPSESEDALWLRAVGTAQEQFPEQRCLTLIEDRERIGLLRPSTKPT